MQINKWMQFQLLMLGFLIVVLHYKQYCTTILYYSCTKHRGNEQLVYIEMMWCIMHAIKASHIPKYTIKNCCLNVSRCIVCVCGLAESLPLQSVTGTECRIDFGTSVVWTLNVAAVIACQTLDQCALDSSSLLHLSPSRIMWKIARLGTEQIYFPFVYTSSLTILSNLWCLFALNRGWGVFFLHWLYSELLHSVSNVEFKMFISFRRTLQSLVVIRIYCFVVVS